MRTAFLFSMGLFMTINSFGFSPSLDFIRKNYEEAVSDKEVREKLIEKLELFAPTAVHLAYLGAFQTIWAKSEKIRPDF